MARGVPIDDAVRAAVIADVTLGSTISEAARKHGVSRRSVERWCETSGVELVGCAPVAHQKPRDLGALVADYLATGLETLTAQARVTGDPGWIAQQPAGELAIFHGVLADKLVRILAALETGHAEPSDPHRG